MVGSSKGNLKASAIEVYNNSPFDLLNDRKPLQMSRSENAAPSVARVISKLARGPEGGSQFSTSQVGLNGEHPASCSCHDCFKAQEAAKEARKQRIALARGEILPQLTDRLQQGASIRLRRTAKTPKNKFLRGGSSKQTIGEARTVGETLWDLKTTNDVAQFARQIEMSRVAHGHALNARSSRSHCIVRLQSTAVSGDGQLVKQCFTFVDLAGSERTGKSGVEGQRMSEAMGINNSLTVLGRCMRAVGGDKTHVPWREAALCQLLRTSFEGKSSTHTAVVVNISPEHEDETLCTLRFGETVSSVRNSATVVISQDADTEIERLQRQVERLRAKKKGMEESGQAGGFVEGCLPTEKLSLQSNMKKLAGIRSNLTDLKTMLIEAGSGDQRKRKAIAEKIEAAKNEEYNMDALVFRQQGPDKFGVKSLWKDATPMFMAVTADLEEKENQLRMATGR
jgi:hypothetical protein